MRFLKITQIYCTHIKNLTKLSAKIWRRVIILLASIAIAILFFRYEFYSFKAQITHKSIETFQFYQLVMMSVSAMATFSAVLVALFKDQLYSLFKFAEFHITPRESDFIYENLSQMKGSDGQVVPDNTLIAESYEVFLSVFNKGNKSAVGCTLQLISLDFTGNGHAKSHSIPVTTSPRLTWSNHDSSEMTLYGHTEGIVSILKIYPENSGPPPTPGNGQSSTVTFAIGGITANNGEFNNGTWIATFQLCSKDTKPIEYRLKVVWNNTIWKPRKNEFMTVISVTEETQERKKKKK
jgi:hypothetical protein